MGSTAWVLLDESPERSLGRAMAWASSRGLDDVQVAADSGTGVLARRAAAFDPAPTVWRVEETSLVPAEPEAPPDHRSPPREADELIALLDAAGVDLVQEHGEIVGEVLGLEVARIMSGPDGTSRIEVGVGRHDRDAFVMIHGDRPDPAAVQAVVDEVRKHRAQDAAPHPLNRLAPERWLRRRLLNEPGLVGARSLEAVAPPLLPATVKDPDPAPALGEDEAGRPLVVVASTGIDLDLVPSGADARLAHSPAARLVLAVPERDDHPVTRRLAAWLADPAEIVALP